MALRYSVAARNFMAGFGSFKQAFQNGRIEYYTGAQPAVPEDAVIGTLLCTITAASGAYTAETPSSGSVTLTGGAAGSVDTITVNSVNILGASVPYTTSLTVTAQNVANQINMFYDGGDYIASASGAVITLTASPGQGTAPNTLVVAATSTTITTTTANMSGGVAAVNGLQLNFPANNTISKNPNQAWTGVNVASGTVGWYRWYGCAADTGALDSNQEFIREDGAVANSGAQMNLVTTALTSGATETVANWDRILPTS